MHLMFVEELATAHNSCSEKEKQEACEITSTHRRTQTRKHAELRPQLINFVLAVNNGAIFLLIVSAGDIYLRFLNHASNMTDCAGRRNVLIEDLYTRSSKRHLLQRMERHGNSG